MAPDAAVNENCVEKSVVDFENAEGDDDGSSSVAENTNDDSIPDDEDDNDDNNSSSDDEDRDGLRDVVDIDSDNHECSSKEIKIVFDESQQRTEFGSGRKIFWYEKNKILFSNRSDVGLLVLTMRRSWRTKKVRLKNHSGRMIGSRAEFVGIIRRPTETAIKVDNMRQ